MKEKVLLSILIPTYNRVDYLMNNLTVLISQINDEIRPLIEIRISDNCSTDNTVEQLKLLKKNNEIIEYSVNEKNLGADGNFLKLIKEAKGKFLWLYGDDEYFLENGLEKIISYVKKNQDTGIFHIGNSKRRRIINYDNQVKFMKKVNYSISFITAHIFNSENIDYENIDYEKYYNSCLIQELFYFQALKNSKKNSIIKDKIFTTDRAENIGGYKLFEVFGINQNDILIFFESIGLNKKIRVNMNKKMCIDFFPQYILMSRINDNKNKWINENVENALEPIVKDYMEYKLFCKPLIYLPLSKAKIYLKFTKKIKKIYKIIFGI